MNWDIRFQCTSISILQLFIQACLSLCIENKLWFGWIRLSNQSLKVRQRDICPYGTLISTVSRNRRRFSFASLTCLKHEARSFNGSGNTTGLHYVGALLYITLKRDKKSTEKWGTSLAHALWEHTLGKPKWGKAPVHTQEKLTCRCFIKEGAYCTSPTASPISEQTKSFV